MEAVPSTIDGAPLTPQARANLGRLMRLAAAAQAEVGPGDRDPAEDVAVSVLDAFALQHVKRGGAWRPRPVLRLSTGVVVAGNQDRS